MMRFSPVVALAAIIGVVPTFPGLAFVHDLNADAALGAPQMVEISGYQGDAAEPFLSRDGRLLFFNNGYGEGTDTNLHVAEHVNDLRFEYRGEVGGANSASLDAVASVDNASSFYFVSARSYETTRSTVHRGRLDPSGTKVSDVSRVAGLEASGPAMVVFDAEVAPDGDALLFAEGQFLPFVSLGLPVTGDLKLARRTTNGFARDPSGTASLTRVNSIALEYAPAISPDGLTLSFTRFAGAPGVSNPRIFLARRPRETAAFASPVPVSAATGFVEAATFTPGGNAIYYHHRVDGRFRVERLEIGSSSP